MVSRSIVDKRWNHNRNIVGGKRMLEEILVMSKEPIDTETYLDNSREGKRESLPEMKPVTFSFKNALKEAISDEYKQK